MTHKSNALGKVQAHKFKGDPIHAPDSLPPPPPPPPLKKVPQGWQLVQWGDFLKPSVIQIEILFDARKAVYPLRGRPNRSSDLGLCWDHIDFFLTK